jgi:hypothetical protein
MKGLPRLHPVHFLLIFAWVVFHHSITTAVVWTFSHASAWVLRYVSASEIVAIAGIALAGNILYLEWKCRAQAHSRVNEQVFDNLLLQVELAKHPPSDSAPPRPLKPRPKANPQNQIAKRNFLPFIIYHLHFTVRPIHEPVACEPPAFVLYPSDFTLHPSAFTLSP